jgi:DNA-binding CsgD family transcriptional regulator
VQAVLLGRARECAAIERVLAAVTQPVAAVLVLCGPPGIGKTSLLDWTAGTATDMDLLRARALEGEQHNRWALLRQMMKKVPVDIATLVPSQQDALGAVAAGISDDPVAAALAFVALLSAAATARPLLVVVDDVHWADEASRFALRFVARRIEHEPVAMLFAEEEVGSGAGPLPALRVTGLSPIDAVTLVEGQMDTRVAEEVAAATDGNPLAMLELGRALSPAQRRGSEPLGAVVLLSDALRRTYERTVLPLTEEQRYLLLVVAAEPGLERRRFDAVARAVGVDERQVDRVLATGLLTCDDHRLEYTRAAMRDVVYEQAPSAVRRRAHRDLADVSHGELEADHRAWHLAAAADGSDEGAAAALEVAAQRARGRNDPWGAGDALIRAAELSADRARRVARLRAAGAAYASGDLNEAALQAYERALAEAEEPDRVGIQIAMSAPRLLVSIDPETPVELAGLAAQIRDTDPLHASALDGLAALTCLTLGELEKGRALTSRALCGHPEPGLRVEQLAHVVDALLAALGGDRDRAARALLEVRSPPPEVWQSRSIFLFEDLAAEGLVWVNEYSAASRLVMDLVEQSRDANAMVVLSRALNIRADLYLRTGHWDAAHADASESVAIAGEIDARGPLAFALAVTARLEAALGRSDDARWHGHESLAQTETVGLRMNTLWAHSALGFLALGLGDGGGAIRWLEEARTFAESQDVRSIVATPWAPDLVEAYSRVGRRDDARRLVDQLEAWDPAAQGPLAEALVARSRALVVEAGADDHFARALDAHGGVLAPFERARTLLSKGESLRRERRTAESAPALEEAASVFDRLGAVPWRDRALAELDARRKVVVRSTSSGASALTPQEFRVASEVASGATNREAAAALFLSPRTVEHHLATVYRKLGVRSRSELTRLVATHPDFQIALERERDGR